MKQKKLKITSHSLTTSTSSFAGNFGFWWVTYYPNSIWTCLIRFWFLVAPSWEHHYQKGSPIVFVVFTPSIQLQIWWFPEMGVPLNHPLKKKHSKSSSYWGTPIYGNPNMLISNPTYCGQMHDVVQLYWFEKKTKITSCTTKINGNFAASLIINQQKQIQFLSYQRWITPD